MKLRGLIDEDIVNYKKTSMTLMFPYCDFKCGKKYCQNSALATAPIIEIGAVELVERYVNNPLTKAICFQGMDPLYSKSIPEIIEFISILRIGKYKCNDDIVIYTGYIEEEVKKYINVLQRYKNIIIKFGRFIPDQEPHYDEILGVNLASNNQYAKKIS